MSPCQLQCRHYSSRHTLFSQIVLTDNILCKDKHTATLEINAKKKKCFEKLVESILWFSHSCSSMIQHFPYINMVILQYIMNKTVLHYKQMQIQIFWLLASDFSTLPYITIVRSVAYSTKTSIHPSIHYLYIICTPLNPLQGRGVNKNNNMKTEWFNC